MSEGQQIRIRGHELRCKHCAGTLFISRRAQLNTSFLEFFDLGWLNKAADIYVCAQCGFLHWFLEPQAEWVSQSQTHAKPEVKELEPEEQTLEPEAEEPAGDDSEATDCLSCGKKIPAGTATCPACGWSYK